MAAVLSVRGLSKAYPSFALREVSFEMAPGTIMGFVGRNGAGKTTTLKSMLGFVHPDAGEVEFFEMRMREHEFEIKERISFTFGEVNFYLKKTIRQVTDAYRPFFAGWDEHAYRAHLERFQLVATKQLGQLSQGMRVKYALTLALSHGAELLVLDEPTSGLDPVSRDELLRLFRGLVADGRTSILFSTQILSDLQRSADTITYIKQGRVLASTRPGRLPGRPSPSRWRGR
ncbi:ABC transporter ATP-binding protein [Enemella evansiae]|uniref:ABC transporter ATP-binding protein n=1 Tax=Enemella evansiae TaxID=2016499 RepID=UPI000B95EBC2|nr:ABC transporter ATP-binding protein [Enemella evansiae]OYO15097.1 ABC transporter ATP-binding protein [Enemella evansiae]OYO20168.1 ABC transporter ATP-binding protein [Enemella evansiae]TDO92636.1 ABC-2 type transport system ATP-binding protein [Enemella evansiae]